jgi:anti-anti-sigma factor
MSHSIIQSSAYPLSGEVDLAVAAPMGQDLTRVARETSGSEAAFDCTDLTFIDAAGITMLLNVASRSGKRVRLLNVRPGCRRVFEILDLCDRFGVEARSPGQPGRLPLSA